MPNTTVSPPRIIRDTNLIPFVGGIVVVVMSVVGLGSLLTWKFGKVQPPILE